MVMKSLSFWIVGVSTLALAVTAASLADGPRDTKVTQDRVVSEAIVGSSDTGALANGEIAIGPAVPIRPGVARRRIVIDTNGNLVTGALAGTGTLIYSNSFGKSTFGPSGGIALARIADDIATVAQPGSTLQRYVVRVTGDKAGFGQGQGDYTVKLALHEACPGAEPDPIPGTEVERLVQIGVDVNDASDILEIEVIISPITPVAINEINYLSVRFSRDFCGVQVGAPAKLGFSGDRFDFPGSACGANMGLYPRSPHASFGVDLYANEDLPLSHIAYKASKHSGGFLTPGIGVRYAESIRIGVPRCNLIGYKLAFKGNGIIEADLRTCLDNINPAFGCQVPGSRHAFFSSALEDVQVEYYALPEPFDIVNSTLFMTFRTTSAECGPIMTCKGALLGFTPDLYFVYNGSEWETITEDGSCYLAFDITLVCEGQPVAGACCDMVLLDDEDEAVCRDGLPEINCPFPDLWEERDICEGVCVGGLDDGATCTRQADCDGGDCDGPFPDPCGVAACCRPLDADPGGCDNVTQNQCFAIEPVENPRRYDRGSICNQDGHICPRPACIGREGDCFAPRDAFCVGGRDHGQMCDPLHGPTPHCIVAACTGGPRDGELCTEGQNFCTDGVCERGICVGSPGCENPFCCSDVCNIDPPCCNEHWDFICANTAVRVCVQPPGNDECAPIGRAEGARFVDISGGAIVDANSLTGTANTSDPGFCCHTGLVNEPTVGAGSQAANTVWFWFFAGEASDKVFLSTCCTPRIPGARGDDSLIQVFGLADPDRGVCTDLSPCSLRANDCVDGSRCELDLNVACDSLIPVACNDDNESCSCGGNPEPTRSLLCASGLIPGDPYIVMIGSKTDSEDDRGIFELALSTSCSGEPVLHNDRCTDAEVPVGSDDPKSYPLTVEFDLSGATFDESPATFDCPGPPSFCLRTMKNDVWYDWTAPCNGTINIDTCDGTDTPDTGMVVYRGCDCPVETGDIIACNDFQLNPCFLGSRVNFEVEEGQCYKIRLAGHLGGEPAGPLNFDLTCTQCPTGPVTFTDPESGTVDARQPHAVDDSNLRQGIDTITVLASPGADNPVCWSLCETDIDGSPNSITGVVDNGDGSFTISLDRTITIGEATTISYIDDIGVVTRGEFFSHPANATGSSTSTSNDVLAIMGYLDGFPPRYGIYSSDIDHSGEMAAPDILRLIDLLNGGGAFTVWQDSVRPDCGVCCSP